MKYVYKRATENNFRSPCAFSSRILHTQQRLYQHAQTAEDEHINNDPPDLGLVDMAVDTAADPHADERRRNGQRRDLPAQRREHAVCAVHDHAENVLHEEHEADTAAEFSSALCGALQIDQKQQIDPEQS